MQTLYRTQEAEDRRRSVAIFSLGLIVTLATITPIGVLQRGSDIEVVFVNFEVLDDPHVPGVLKFLAVFPLVAGIVAMVMAGVRGLARGIAVLACGLVPVLFILSGSEVRMVLSWLIRFDAGPAGLGGMLVLSMAAWLLIFIGSRMLVYRPAVLAGAIVAAIGGWLHIATLFMPVLPSEAGTIPLLAPFAMLSQDHALVTFGIGSALSMLLMIGAAIACIITPWKQEADERSSLGAAAFRMLVLGALVYPALMAWHVIEHIPDHAPAAEIALGLLAILKFVLLFVGMYLLIPVGAADLAIEITPLTSPGRGGRAGTARQATDRLESLREAYQRGLVTQEEYDRKRRQIVDEI